jgi:hippurate hydrolase
MYIPHACWVLRKSQRNKKRLEGTIKLIFQPGEERNPGGAGLLIKEGVLEPRPQAISDYGAPQLETGLLSFREGRSWPVPMKLYHH